MSSPLMPGLLNGEEPPIGVGSISFLMNSLFFHELVVLILHEHHFVNQGLAEVLLLKLLILLVVPELRS